MSNQSPIQIGSEVTPVNAVYSRLQNGDFYQLIEGKRYTITALGSGFAVLSDDDSTDSYIAQVADLKPWGEFAPL